MNSSTTDVNLHFLQPEAEAYLFRFCCEKALTFAKTRTFYIKNKQASPAQPRKSNAK